MGEKSKLVQAIEARPRKVYEFEVQGFFDLGGKAVHKIGIRSATKSEQDKSIIAAYQRIEELSGHDRYKGDEDLIVDAKTIQILFHVCRRAEEGDKKSGYRYPAFPGPAWMADNLTTDQIAVLLHLYSEVREKEGPLRSSISMDDIRTMAKLCSDSSDTDIPEHVLAAAEREWLTQAFVLLSGLYQELVNAQGETGRDPLAQPPPSGDAEHLDDVEHHGGDSGKGSVDGAPDEEVQEPNR
jgi:hypothetical protein